MYCTPLAWIGSHTERSESVRLSQFRSSCRLLNWEHTDYNRRGVFEDISYRKIWKKHRKKIQSFFTSCHTLISDVTTDILQLSKAKHLLGHHCLGCGQNCNMLVGVNPQVWITFFETVGWCIQWEGFTSMKMWIFNNETGRRKQNENESRGKVKAAASFYLGEGDPGQIRGEVRKGALNKLKFNYLVTLHSRIFPQPWLLSTKENVFGWGSVAVPLAANTHPVWRQFSVDGSLTHAANLHSSQSFNSSILRQ